MMSRLLPKFVRKIIPGVLCPISARTRIHYIKAKFNVEEPLGKADLEATKVESLR